MADYLTQSAFARRWGISRQYVNKLIRRGALALSNNGKLDVVFSDLAVIRSGIGVLCLPDNPKARDQYLKRREIRRSLVSRYEETPPEVELTQEEVDLIKNDPSFKES